MLERLLIEHCAPTLAGLKTANLLRQPHSGALEKEVAHWDSILRQKGVRVQILRGPGDSALIYAYRKERLLRDLMQPGAQEFLTRYGYPENVEGCLERLQERMQEASGFPHEIGLFLGYPLGDVIGFIQHGGKHCKCTGCWKVYCDKQEAQRQFARLRKCKEVYQRLYQSGTPVMKLTVNA